MPVFVTILSVSGSVQLVDVAVADSSDVDKLGISPSLVATV